MKTVMSRTSALAFLFACCIGMASAAAPKNSPQPEYKIEKAPAWVKPVPVDFNANLPQEKQSDGVSYLLFDRQVQIQGSKKQSYSHLALKIQNEGGLEKAANIELRFDPSYQKLLIHSVSIRRGDKTISKLEPAAIKVLQREKSLEQLIFDGSKSATLFLSDVRVGDVVEYAYTLNGSNPVFGGMHYGQFDSQWGVPVQQVYSRLLTEQGHPVEIKLLNGQQPASRSVVGGMQEYLWSQTDVAALRVRDDAPAWFDPYPSVQWSEFKDWHAVVEWALPLYKTPKQLPPELAAEAERIASKYPSLPDRAVEALRYVQKTVRYLGVEVGPGSHAPTQPDVVLSRRFGDCKDKTLLTLTLLRAVGVEASAALVNSRNKRAIQNWQASPGVFDHVIVRAKLGDRYYWIDPTLQPQMGTLDDISQADFGYALVIDADQVGLTEIKKTSAMAYRRQVTTDLDIHAGVGEKALLKMTTFLDGLSAERMRSILAKETPEDMQKQLLNYLASHYQGIQVARPYEVYDNTENNQLILTEYYEIPDFWTRAKSGRFQAYVVSPDVYDYLRMPRNTVRTEPLSLFHPAEIRQTTYIQLPESWTMKDESLQIIDPAFVFDSSTRYASGRLTLVDTYRTLTDAVDPQNMPTYLSNLKKARNMLGYSFDRPAKEGE